MRRLVPALLALCGLGAGLGAGVALAPSTADPTGAEPGLAAAPGTASGEAGTNGSGAGHGSETGAQTGAESGSETGAKTGDDGHASGGAAAAPHGSVPSAAESHGGGGPSELGAGGEAEAEFVKLNNQFVVPVVAEGRVAALVVMSVSLEVAPGAREAVFSHEPKLRDSFLRVLFDHANAGGFDGIFTTSENLGTLRMALLEAARSVLGDRVADVLILDMMRQDT
jgi:hypothetical protein